MDNDKKEKPIMKDPTQSQEFKQMMMEDVLDKLCFITKRDIFVMLPEKEEERIPYLVKEIKKTLDRIK